VDLQVVGYPTLDTPVADILGHSKQPWVVGYLPAGLHAVGIPGDILTAGILAVGFLDNLLTSDILGHGIHAFDIPGHIPASGPPVYIPASGNPCLLGDLQIVCLPAVGFPGDMATSDILGPDIQFV